MVFAHFVVFQSAGIFVKSLQRVLHSADQNQLQKFLEVKLPTFVQMIHVPTMAKALPHDLSLATHQ